MPNHFFMSGIKLVGVFEWFHIREFLLPCHGVICNTTYHCDCIRVPFILGSRINIASWPILGSHISLYSWYPLTNDLTRRKTLLVSILLSWRERTMFTKLHLLLFLANNYLGWYVWQGQRSMWSWCNLLTVLHAPDWCVYGIKLLGCAVFWYSMMSQLASWNCKENTTYWCLKCAKLVCNRSSSCHVAASEDEPGWKAGHCIAFCPVLCLLKRIFRNCNWIHSVHFITIIIKLLFCEAVKE